MNARIRAVLFCSSLLLGCLLSQCATEPPYLPPGAGTGISLDTGPNRRGRQETRYLENTTPPPMPNPDPGGTAIANAPVYDTPDTIGTTPPVNEPAPVNTTPPVDTAASTEPPPDQKPAPTSGTPEQLPFGLPVPGKKGYVYSPFDKTQMVDVRGIPPGKKVRCPYTSKIFLVP